jgi:hypothetical protein
MRLTILVIGVWLAHACRPAPIARDGDARVVPVPVIAPDSEPAWVHDDTSIVTARGRSQPVIRDVVLVLFHPNATQAERQAAIDRVSGKVVGGGRLNGVEGYYLVLLPRDTTHTLLFEALPVLKAMPGVLVAMPDYAFRLDNTPLHSSWPLLTDQLPDLDTSRVFTFPGDSLRIFRTDISISFKPNVTDSAKAAFFQRRSMTVIGITLAGRFFVRVPDPGPNSDAFRRMLEAVRREPEVELAALIPRDPLEQR